MTASGFFRLHPNLHHALVNELGWRSLRPVQELAVDAILDGCNAVVLTPTAGGKTEASIFPLLSRILTLCAFWTSDVANSAGINFYSS